jgi:alpha-mannosidase
MKASSSGMLLQVRENGPVRAVLAGKTCLGEGCAVEMRYILDAGSKALRIELDVDWQVEHSVLRYYLPTRLQGATARYGAPYGSVARAQKPGTPHEEAMWEVPGSRWAAVTGESGQSGLAIVSEAKYGFACRDGELSLTLLRAPMDLASEWPLNPRRHLPKHQVEFGQHTLRFALVRHHAESTQGQLSTPAMAEALYAPAPVVRTARQTVQPPLRFTSDLGSVIPSWVLPSQDGQAYILRLNETCGLDGQVRIAFTQPFKRVSRVDFLERAMGGGCVQQISPTEILVTVGPYQLVSLKVE